MRALLRKTLEGAGLSVPEADNGRAALDRLREAAPGLVLLDLMMPEMDGFDFLVELRPTAAWRMIPVIVITARDLSSDDRRRLEPTAPAVSATVCESSIVDGAAPAAKVVRKIPTGVPVTEVVDRQIMALLWTTARESTLVPSEIVTVAGSGKVFAALAPCTGSAFPVCVRLNSRKCQRCWTHDEPSCCAFRQTN